MKVAVTAQGQDLDSPVDPRFGRAPYFVVVDTETGHADAHDNSQNVAATQGAGVQAGRNVVDLGVEAVLTGNVGPKAFSALRAGNVRIYLGAAGTVAETVEQFKAGRLTPADDANVPGGWG